MKDKLLGYLSVCGVVVATSALVSVIWNYVVTNIIATALPISFITSLIGTSLFFAVVLLFNLVKAYIKGLRDRIKLQMAYKTIKQFTSKNDMIAPDVFRHFYRLNNDVLISYLKLKKNK